ncbi:MAG: ADP-glyceromanno-heptose 6-epimerase [Desulfobacterales bacterium]|nr:ADP-glyceromanno-heptose 6-epimerase [Desulfobacterales bacterium]
MYIVTGGAGFIGSAVVWKLNQMGIDDILVVDNLGKSEKWKNLVNRKYLDYVHKSKFLELLNHEHFGGIHAIIHMGACSSTTERDSDYLYSNNFKFSKSIAEYAVNRGIRLINASSAATYGDGLTGFDDNEDSIEMLKPLNMYGYSKQIFDIWAKKSNLLDKIVSLKFFNVFGPNEYHKDDMSSVIYKSYNQIRESGKIKLFKSYKPNYADGEQMRDFVYVKDCVEIIFKLIENPNVNGIFNIGTGRARTWNDLAKSVFKAMNVPVNIEYVPMPESIRDRYQYFTQAEMKKLNDSPCALNFTSLEIAAEDYIKNYLMKADMYL